MVSTSKLECPAFTIESGQLTKHSSGSRTSFQFEARSSRHFPDGGFDFDVYVVLFDAQGRFVYRRSADRPRPVLANRAAWTHEIENDVLANATSLVYDIHHRLDYRRRIVAGELPELPAQADGSDYFRWIGLDPRTLEDRVVKLDVGIWARGSSIDITMSQTPKITTDTCRTEWEIDFLDEHNLVVASRNGSTSMNYGLPAHDDTSLSIERKVLRTLKFFELRGKTELRAIAKLPVDTLP